jgi:DNA-binding response OmpR family regulator
MATKNAKSRVLVVDNDPRIAGMLRDVLVTEGYHVRAAAEGERAIACLRAWRPTLVITDLRMAPMNGIELCRRIRAESNVPIIMVSGEGVEWSKVEALDSGADDYMVKPFGVAELVGCKNWDRVE